MRYAAPYVIAAIIGVAVDEIFHLHVAAWITLLPTIWVFADRQKRIQAAKDDEEERLLRHDQ